MSEAGAAGIRTVAADVPLVAAVEAVPHLVAELVDGHAAEVPIHRRGAARPVAGALEPFLACAYAHTVTNCCTSITTRSRASNR